MLCIPNPPAKLRDLPLDRFGVVELLGPHERPVQTLFMALGNERVAFDQDGVEFP